MATAFPAHRNMQEYRWKLCILSICVILASGFGVFTAFLAGDPYLLMMRMAAGRVSIVGSCFGSLIPFLVSCLLIVHSRPRLVYAVCAVQIFLFTACGWAIRYAFGSAGWLIAFLLQFSRLFYMPAVLYLAVCKLSGQYSRKRTVYLMITGVVIGMLDFALISPFLAGLMDHYETMGRYTIHVGLDWCL